MSRPDVITVPPGQKKQRLDLFLVGHLEHATRTRVQRAIREGYVLIDGARTRASHPVVPGEVIRISLPAPPPHALQPEPILLDVVYEDAHLLVVNKPAGMVVHPAHGHRTGTLVNALLYHCADLSGLNGPTRAGIVHRLDKDTSGLLVVAKSDTAHTHLAKQFSRKTIGRRYLAIVWGRFQRPKGTIRGDIGRSLSDRKRMAVVTGGKSAVTEYAVLERFPYLTLLELHLQTGRTHQIRVHLSHIHHPVFGDVTYQGRRIMYGPGTSKQRSEVQAFLALINRQALHAKTLSFIHPSTGKKMEFDSPLPRDFSGVLDAVRRASAEGE
jgi:23S rRNA pseudouridine1911/1915/1917 synthase